MRIRDLQWKGLPMWPPEWWMSDEGAGEAGVLKNAQLRTDQTPPCIAVVANNGGQDMNGIILLENSSHLEILCQVLKANIGKPLQEIGDLDFLMPIPRKGPKQIRRQITSRSATLPHAAVELKFKR